MQLHSGLKDSHYEAMHKLGMTDEEIETDWKVLIDEYETWCCDTQGDTDDRLQQSVAH